MVIDELFTEGTARDRPFSAHTVKADLSNKLDDLRVEDEQVGHSGPPSEPARAGDKGDTELYECRLTTSKGYGLFARKGLKRGTLIFEEAALVSLPAYVRYDGLAASALLIRRLEKLAAAQQDAYSRLHFNVDIVHPLLQDHLGERTKDFAIFETNAVSLKDDDSGLFLTYSRINHSCTPNTYNYYQPVGKKEVVYALRDIDQGEEITTSYVDLLRPRADRAALLQQWSFDCQCEACYGPGAAASNKRRERIEHLVETCAYLSPKDSSVINSAPLRYSVPKTTTGRLALAEELADLLKAEGLVDRQLGDMYRACSNCSLELDQLDKAMAYARGALDIQKACYGPTYKPDDDAGALLEKLEAIADARREAAREAEEQQKRQEREATEKAAHEEARKMREAAKKATKKAKRAIRGAAEKVTAEADEAELLISKLSTEEIGALAGRLKGVSDGGEIRKVFQDEVKRLVGAEQLEEGELSSFA